MANGEVTGELSNGSWPNSTSLLGNAALTSDDLNNHNLSGALDTETHFDIQGDILSEFDDLSTRNLYGSFSSDGITFDIAGELTANEAVVEQYDGSYECVSKAHSEQTLPTANKFLTEDIRVKKIPYSEVSNPYGGITVNIAEPDN